jgi:hypothetical protein
MGYSRTINFSAPTDVGRVGMFHIFNGQRSDQMALSSFVEAGQIYYAGSVAIIEETIGATFVVDSPEFIDVDYRWWQPKKYIGTWQLLEAEPNLWLGDEQKCGFVNSERFKVTARYSFPIGADSMAETESGISIVDNCNYALGELGLAVPPFTAKIQAPVADTALFTVRNTIKPSKLKAATITLQAHNLVMFLNEGVRIETATHTVDLVQILAISDKKAEAASCLLPKSQQGKTCKEQFDEFVAANGGYRDNTPLGSLPPGGVIFSTEAAGTRNDVYGLFQDAWDCPTDPGNGFFFWKAIAR